MGIRYNKLIVAFLTVTIMILSTSIFATTDSEMLNIIQNWMGNSKYTVQTNNGTTSQTVERSRNKIRPVDGFR